VAVIDVAGYVADLKDHSVDHGFHVHDERHFVETYSLRQVWEVELHPEDGCGGAVDLHLALEVDPRTLLSFEDAVFGLPEDEEPPDDFHFPLTFTWALPPLPHGPDLLRLAIDLAGVGGIELPLEVSAIDSYASATDAAEPPLLPPGTRSPRRGLRVGPKAEFSVELPMANSSILVLPSAMAPADRSFSTTVAS